ncbi:hypothetical protein HY003_00725 [Candidatus Saccharibacteria bacterium]|nr:hypothetical protein [Candidatus Saccharibacteria bacterium]MBI3337806.1 hypothetical protein [Candidatus Saccharibacteria bacterium]
MKQKDIIVIIVVTFISVVISLLLSTKLFDPPKNRTTEVEVVQSITSDFLTPDKKYFNDKSLNPTKLIQIGDSSNSQPFNNNQTQQ